MSREAIRKARNAEMMGDDIIGKYLSEETFDLKEVLDSEEVLGSKEVLDSNESKTTGDKLRRFMHHEETSKPRRVLGSGIHGVVFSAVIKDTKYALKVVRMPPTQPRIPKLSDILRSSRIGSNPVLSSIHMRLLSTPRRSRTRAEHLLGWTRTIKTESGLLSVMDG